MKPSEIINVFEREQFVPYDLRTSDGRVYRVSHPDFVHRSKDGTIIYLQTDDDRLQRIDSSHVVVIEDVNAPARA